MEPGKSRIRSTYIPLSPLARATHLAPSILEFNKRSAPYFIGSIT